MAAGDREKTTAQGPPQSIFCYRQISERNPEGPKQLNGFMSSVTLVEARAARTRPLHRRNRPLVGRVDH